MNETLGKWLRFPGRLLIRFTSLLEQRPRVASIILVILILAFFGNGLRIIREKPQGLFSTTSRSDFDDYFTASRTVAKGGDPYKVKDLADVRKNFNPDDLKNFKNFEELVKKIKGVGTYLYLPLTATALLPLTHLPYSPAALIYQLISILALVLFIFVLYRYGDKDRLIQIPLVLALLVFSRFFMENSGNGNIGFFLILLMGSSLLLGWDEKPWVGFLGGVLLGAAIVMKITPIFLGLVFIGGRRWAAMFGAGFGVLFFLAMPAVFLGWDYNLELIGNWYTLILDNFNKVAIIRPWRNNQTISATLGKLFVARSDASQVVYGLPLVSDGLASSHAFLIRMTNLVKGSNAFFYLASFLTALGLFVRGGSFTRSGNFMKLDVPLRLTMLALCASLFASGVSWFHAYSILFLPVFFRLYQRYLMDRPLLFGDKFALGSLVFFGPVFMLLPVYLRKMFAVYSIFTFLMILVFCFEAFYLWRIVFRKREEPA